MTAPLLAELASLVPENVGRTVLVAVDGVDGAGKTVFADALAAALGRPTVRASADDFHRPRAERYRRGRTSPEGFWLDSYDYPALRGGLLDPLRGNGRYRLASHDLETDERITPPQHEAQPGSVLVVDGMFLHCEEVRDYWDLSIFLDVPFTETAQRMARRDGSDPDPGHPSMARYVQGQLLYLNACDPAGRADVVVDNTDWANPVIRKRP